MVAANGIVALPAELAQQVINFMRSTGVDVVSGAELVFKSAYDEVVSQLDGANKAHATANETVTQLRKIISAGAGTIGELRGKITEHAGKAAWMTAGGTVLTLLGAFGLYYASIMDTTVA